MKLVYRAKSIIEPDLLYQKDSKKLCGYLYLKNHIHYSDQTYENGTERKLNTYFFSWLDSSEELESLRMLF